MSTRYKDSQRPRPLVFAVDSIVLWRGVDRSQLGQGLLGWYQVRGRPEVVARSAVRYLHEGPTLGMFPEEFKTQQPILVAFSFCYLICIGLYKGRCSTTHFSLFRDCLRARPHRPFSLLFFYLIDLLYLHGLRIRTACFSQVCLFVLIAPGSILFRIGPERRRKAGMPTDVCLFSNSPDPIVPILRTSSAKVTEWVSRQSLM